MKAFEPARPGLFTRNDLADIYTALYIAMPIGGDYGAGYASALLAVGLATGMRVRIDDISRVVVEVVTR